MRIRMRRERGGGKSGKEQRVSINLMNYGKIRDAGRKPQLMARYSHPNASDLASSSSPPIGLITVIGADLEGIR